MTACTNQVSSCYQKPLIRLPYIFARKNNCEGFLCTKCYKHYEKIMTSCGGEIEKVWQNGREVDCVCQKCGKSYGKNYIFSEEFREKILGQNIRL